MTAKLRAAPPAPRANPSSAPRAIPRGARQAAMAAVLLILAAAFSRAESVGGEGLSTRREGRRYFSEGSFELPCPPESVRRVLGELEGYREWALAGLDGKDPLSAGKIGVFTDIGPGGPGILRVRYDVNLPWPLGSRDNLARFAWTPLPEGGRYRALALEPSVAYSAASAELLLEASGAGGSRLTIRLEVDFAWYVAGFLPAPVYNSGVAWRARRFAENLAGRAGPAAPGVPKR